MRSSRTTLRPWAARLSANAICPCGGTNADSIVADIAATRPDVILNTINGDSNVAFFQALRAAGVTPQKIPTPVV